MYKKIEGHVSTRSIYAKQLVEEGVFTQQEADAMMARFMHMM